jgi:hypothetical protein
LVSSTSYFIPITLRIQYLLILFKAGTKRVGMPAVMLGNRLDEASEAREVPLRKAQQLGKADSVPVFEVSAKTGPFSSNSFLIEFDLIFLRR